MVQCLCEFGGTLRFLEVRAQLNVQSKGKGDLEDNLTAVGRRPPKSAYANLSALSQEGLLRDWRKGDHNVLHLAGSPNLWPNPLLG